jgi:ABC-type multidrug transport system ATPase subunit
VGVIRNGKLITIGNPDELRLGKGGRKLEIIGRDINEQTLTFLQARPEVARAEIQINRLLIELRSESEIGPLVTLIEQSGAEVEEIRRSGTSLEDLFLTLMKEENK